MLIYIDGPVANPECKPKDEIDHTKIDKNQVYSSAYNSKLLFGGAVKQLQVSMLAIGGADNFDIGGNPSEDAEETCGSCRVKNIEDIPDDIMEATR